jgi:AmmeMemoRadiSam system protein B
MSHYLPAARAKALDRLAIDRILALDSRGLVETVFGRDISMCGVLPTAAALVAAVSLGATNAELIAYATSGDVTGDDREVVGYAGFRLV